MTTTEIDLAYFKRLLKQKHDEINEIIKTGDTAAQPVELDQTRVGRLTRMDAMRAQAMSIEAKRRRNLELVRIKSALERIDEGDYGKCLECAEMIALPRLQHNPSVTLCIHCAEQHE